MPVELRIGDVQIDGGRIAQRPLPAAVAAPRASRCECHRSRSPLHQVLRIARKVARDRVIFTVDPDARHGHKTSHRGFDGYKGHVALDPDSELVTATTATAGTSGDADVAEQLLADVLPAELSPSVGQPVDASGTISTTSTQTQRVEVYGDCAYGTGPLLERLEDADAPGGPLQADLQPLICDCTKVILTPVQLRIRYGI
jgi:hypothetical protein